MAFDYSVRFEAIDKISNIVDKINSKVNNLKSSAKNTVVNVKVLHQQAMDRLNQVHNKMKELSKKPIDISLSFASLAGNIATLALPIKKAIEIETAFMGVAKVVDGTGEQIAQLRTDLLDMTKYLPKTASELMAIAEAGGKIGIPIDKLKEYVDVVAKTSTAFDMPVTEINDAFGSFKSMLGYGIPQLTQYGDIVNKLADSTSADAKKIVDISQRASGAFGTLKFDVATVAGLSAFANQLTISSEVGGTALSGMLEKIRGTEMGLKILTQKGGYGLIEIADKFRKLEGVARTKAIADLFGSGEEARLFEKLINRTEVLKEALDTAFSTDTLGSMQREFEKVSNTTANKIKLMANGVERLSLKIGDVLLPSVNDIINYIAPLIDKIGKWAGENKDLILTMSKIIAFGILMTAGFLLIQASLAPILIAIRLYTAIVATATAIVNLFNVALWANPITWVTLGIIALIAIVALLIYYWKDLTVWVTQLWNDFLGFISPLENVGTKISEMTDKFLNFINSYSGISGTISGIISLFDLMVTPIKYVIELIDMFLGKFEIYNQAKEKVKDLAGTVENKVGTAWENTKGFFGFSNNDTNAPQQTTQNDVQIDNVNKNHTIVDVNIKADGATVTEQNAKSTGGRVKLNTASNGV